MLPREIVNFVFPRISMFPSISSRETLRFSGKQNSLFPSRAYIKCIITPVKGSNIYFEYKRCSKHFRVAKKSSVPFIQTKYLRYKAMPTRHIIQVYLELYFFDFSTLSPLCSKNLLTDKHKLTITHGKPPGHLLFMFLL